MERLLAKDPAARPAEASEILEPLAQLAGIKRGDAETLSRTGYLYAADLVGRDTERARLAAFRTALVGGEGASIAVAGRGGEGKTRLLEELKLKVKVDGMHWLVGQCRPEFAAQD